MIKKITALCFTTFVFAGCKDHSQGKFNRNNQCTKEYLKFLQNECSEPVKEWIDYKEGLLMCLKIREVYEIISPFRNCQDTYGLEKQYRKVTHYRKEDFSGQCHYSIRLNELIDCFETILWPKNKASFMEKYAKYQIIQDQIGVVSKTNLVEEYPESVKQLAKKIKNKISEVSFKYEPNKDDLNTKFDLIIRCFDLFTRLTDKFPNIKFEDFLKEYKELSENLDYYIDGAKTDPVGCFIAMIKPKIEGWDERWENFFKGMGNELAKNEFLKYEKCSKLSQDDLRYLIDKVNVAKLLPGIINVDISQKILGFEIEWIHGKNKARLKSDMDEIELNIGNCGNPGVTKIGDFDLIEPGNGKSVLVEMFKYISNLKLIIDDGKGHYVLNQDPSITFKNCAVDKINIREFVENCYQTVF